MTERDHADVVRDWFAAFNRGDVSALVALYHENAEVEDETGTAAGRVAIEARLTAWFVRRRPGFEGTGYRRVRTVGRVEDGRTHAEWTARDVDAESGEARERAGYDHFLVEDGRIRRQREVGHPFALAPDPPGGAPRPSTRAYPARPVVGVGAVIVHEGRVLLIRRRHEPLAGQWSLPGGTLELGETLEAGLAREMREETGLEVEVGPVVEVFDRILHDLEGRVRYHFVLIDYLCRPVGGTLAAASDVDAAVFVAPDDLPGYRLTPKAAAVIARGLAMAGAVA